MSSRFDNLTKLRAHLRGCALLYESDELKHQRSAVMSALFAVADFLEAQSFPAEVLAPILRPALALAERENNNLDLMFSERARGGRPKATLDDHDRTGILAAFANAWLRINKGDGRLQRAKLAEAARKMSGKWFGKVSRANLKTAREIVAQEALNHPAVLVSKEFDSMFDDAFASIDKNGVPVGPIQAFQLMIDYVNESPAARMKGIWKTPAVSPSKSG